MIDFLLYFFIFPGFLFLAFSGILFSWVDRKITARLQWRVGPPFLQPFYDVAKLFIKDTSVPEGANVWVFMLAPVLALLGVLLTSNVLIITWINPYSGFIGDLIVLFYLLVIPQIAAVIGGSASNNPLASVGASREIKSILGYELPLILSIIVVIIKSGGVSIGKIVLAQQQGGSYAYTFSGFLALIVAIVCMQAKTGMPPFDAAEAETELASGNLIEYSGPLLAVWKMAKMMFFVIAPVFITVIFWNGGNKLALAAKVAVLLVISILIKNVNPRVRIDQSIRFFWGIVSFIAAVAVIFAAVGL